MQLWIPLYSFASLDQQTLWTKTDKSVDLVGRISLTQGLSIRLCNGCSRARYTASNPLPTEGKNLFLNLIFLLEKSYLTELPRLPWSYFLWGKSDELLKDFYCNYVTKIKDRVFSLLLELIPCLNTANLCFLHLYVFHNAVSWKYPLDLKSIF